MQEPIWLINGAQTQTLPAGDRGLAYGDGLFETMRVIESEIPLWAYHRRRLNQGCQRLGLAVDENRLRTDLDRLLSMAASPQSVIKIIVSRAGRSAGYATDHELPANLYIRLSPLVDLSSEPVLNAQVCRTTLSVQPLLAGIKHLNRLEQVMAAMELGRSRKEGVLLDTQGHVIEAISSNLIAVIDQVMHCPDLRFSGVEGVMQSYIVDRVKELGMPIESSVMSLDTFMQASEMLVCNSVRGVRNIINLEGYEQTWQSSSMSLGAQLRDLLKDKLNTRFHSF